MNGSDLPDDNPKTAYGAAKVPLHLLPPAALEAEAWVMGLGAEKYGPWNWRDQRVSTSVYVGAAMRHLQAYWSGVTLDSESGQSHLAHVRACMGILLDAAEQDMLNDDRPPTGSRLL